MRDAIITTEIRCVLITCHKADMTRTILSVDFILPSIGLDDVGFLQSSASGSRQQFPCKHPSVVRPVLIVSKTKQDRLIVTMKHLYRC